MFKLVRFAIPLFILLHLQGFVIAQAFTAVGTVTPVSCNGGHNGKIVYGVGGGPGPIYYRWNTGDSGLATGGCTFAVNIANPGAALDSFQVEVIVPIRAGMNTNFSNAVFSDSAGNSIPFWLVDYPGPDTGIFWVGVPFVPSGASQIFLSFCGNDTVSSGTPDSVFEFFDDFDHASYPWQDSALNVVNGGSGSMLYDDTTFFSPSYSMRLIAGASCFLPPYSGGGSDAWLTVNLVNDSLVIDFDDKVETTLYGYCVGGTGTTNYVLEDGVGLGTGQSRGQGGSCASNASGWQDNTSSPFAVTTGSGTIGLRTYGGDCSYSDGWFDDVRVRKYRSNPPVATLDTTPQLVLDSLAAGTYIITMYDSLGLSSTDTFIVTQPTVLAVSIDSVNASCTSPVGAAWAIVTGGTPGYTYWWNNSITTDTTSGLAAGNYEVTITDANGCTATAGTSLSSFGGIPAVTINSSKDSICSGDSVQICATPGFSSYAWSSGDTGSCFYTTYAGTYNVTAYESANCSTVSNNVNVGIFAPSPVTVSVNGDTLTVYSANAYQWYLNGQAIPGATSSLYIATASGTYKVQITDANGCIASSLQVVVTGTQVIQAGNEVQVFPNPSNGSWQLNVSEELIGSQGGIFDATGRIVHRFTINTRQSLINIPGLASGIYELRLNNGKLNFVKKLVFTSGF